MWPPRLFYVLFSSLSSPKLFKFSGAPYGGVFLEVFGVRDFGNQALLLARNPRKRGAGGGKGSSGAVTCMSLKCSHFLLKVVFSNCSLILWTLSFFEMRSVSSSSKLFPVASPHLLFEFRRSPNRSRCFRSSLRVRKRRVPESKHVKQRPA